MTNMTNMTNALLEKRITYNLRLYGFPMFVPYRENKFRQLALEDLMISILKKCTDARFIYGIPVLIAKNKINYNALLKKANSEGLQNKLGWIVEETINSFEALGIKKDLGILKTLVGKITKDESEHYLCIDPTIKSNMEHATARRSKTAAKWNILTTYDTSDFNRILKLYCYGKEKYRLQKSNRFVKTT